jgi:hypothetical protein
MPLKPPKQQAKRGLLPKLKGFLDALSDRYQQALQVIDEALASESLKDKIWAVDLILKRTPAPENSQTSAKSAEKPRTSTDLSQLGEAELLSKIRSHLKDWEP